MNRFHIQYIVNDVLGPSNEVVRDLRVPFGGMSKIRRGGKQSGVGREGGEEALRFFTEPQNVCIQVPG